MKIRRLQKAPQLRCKKQRGVALVLAMMIVALIAVVATELSWRFELNMSRASHRWLGIQSRAYIDSAEAYPMYLLKADAEDAEKKKADYLEEDWAQDLPPTEVDNGFISGRTEDAHGRFNINMMQPEPNKCKNGNPKQQQGQECPELSECDQFNEQQQVFVRLLQIFNLGNEEEPEYLPLEQAKMITEAVIDWIDEDSINRGFESTESDHYESLEPPVAIANQEMVSVSELQMITGMPPNLYKQLLPYVIALPKKEVGKINLNTASAMVLRAIRSPTTCNLEPMSEEQGQELLEFVEQGNEGDRYLAVEELVSAEVPVVWAGDDGRGFNVSGDVLDINQSTYFIFFSEVGIGDSYVKRGASLLKRTEDSNQQGQSGRVTVEVIRRTDANF